MQIRTIVAVAVLLGGAAWAYWPESDTSLIERYQAALYLCYHGPSSAPQEVRDRWCRGIDESAVELRRRGYYL